MVNERPQSVEFGWGARPMIEQFPQLDSETAGHFDADNKAIIRLSMRGIITHSQRDAAIKKATRKIEAELIKCRDSASPPRTEG